MHRLHSSHSESHSGSIALPKVFRKYRNRFALFLFRVPPTGPPYRAPTCRAERSEVRGVPCRAALTLRSEVRVEWAAAGLGGAGLPGSGSGWPRPRKGGEVLGTTKEVLGFL